MRFFRRFTGIASSNRAGGRGVTTGPSRIVGSSSCSAGIDAARCTWVSVHEGEAGPADPVGVFRSGARVGGNKSPTREGSFPLGLSERGDEVADLVDSSLMGVERPLLSPGNTGSSLAKDLGVLAVSYTHLRAHETRHDLVCRLLLEKKNR